MSTAVLVCEVPSAKLSFRVRLLCNENPDVVEKVLAQLPMQSMLGHTVVSGEGFWIPTPAVYTGPGNMVKRHPGAVYFHSPAQSICITYGDTAESAKVNKFAEVLEEDLGTLKEVGKLVYNKTVAQVRHELVEVSVRREGDTGNLPPVDRLMAPVIEFTGDWRLAVACIQQEVNRIWLVEPEEITKVKLGVIESGMGTGGQSFSVLVHLETMLMMVGSGILYRLLMDSEDEEMTLSQMVRATRRHVIQPFDYFEFKADLGLARMKTFGDMYSIALESLSTLDEYRELTAALLTLVTRMHYWIHQVFPWDLGVAFPHRTLEDIPPSFTKVL